ncbi:hypothetical protein BU16DRAFT_539062 [Lophium mytilinum]|uniref:Uncharacterized protein n=1 Tax=Lophium mytilinum TaxID=390894 RepID=A0A6A6QVU8_9PEZI|nr:hypothetical protein BU16DRAFT_539062 [Lophium mytilinum]
MHRGAAATDPRDKIFALHGLASPGQTHGIGPDHFFSKKQIFLNFTRRMLERGENFDILSLAQGCRDCSLPSWVLDAQPDPSSSIDAKQSFAWSADMLPSLGHPRFKASNSSLSRPIFSNNETELGILGMELDVVVRVATHPGHRVFPGINLSSSFRQTLCVDWRNNSRHVLEDECRGGRSLDGCVPFSALRQSTVVLSSDYKTGSRRRILDLLYYVWAVAT